MSKRDDQSTSSSDGDFSFRRFQTQKRPSEVFRLLSRLPPRTTNSVSSASTRRTISKPAPSSIARPVYRNLLADYRREYNEIPRVQPSIRQGGARLDIARRKYRQGELLDDELSRISYNSHTNYSLLDYFTESDRQTVATQELLLNQEESPVLDEEEIARLRRDQITQISYRDHDDDAATVQTNFESIQSHVSEPVDDIPETIALDEEDANVHDDNVPDDRDSVSLDWGDDIDMGEDWEDLNAASSQVPDIVFDDDDVVERTARRIDPNARYIPSASSSIERPFRPQFIKDLYSVHLDLEQQLSVPSSYFGKLWDLYADQLGHDLKAYMNHRRNNSAEDNILLKKDVLLLMKRQRLITDEPTTLSKLASQYLPRDDKGALLPLAQSYNVLYPTPKPPLSTNTFSDIEDEEESEIGSRG